MHVGENGQKVKCRCHRCGRSPQSAACTRWCIQSLTIIFYNEQRTCGSIRLIKPRYVLPQPVRVYGNVCSFIKTKQRRRRGRWRKKTQSTMSSGLVVSHLDAQPTEDIICDALSKEWTMCQNDLMLVNIYPGIKHKWSGCARVHHQLATTTTYCLTLEKCFNAC